MKKSVAVRRSQVSVSRPGVLVCPFARPSRTAALLACSFRRLGSTSEARSTSEPTRRASTSELHKKKSSVPWTLTVQEELGSRTGVWRTPLAAWLAITRFYPQNALIWAEPKASVLLIRSERHAPVPESR